MGRFDWVALAETAYRLDCSDAEWSEAVGALVGPEFDVGHGYLGGLVARDKKGYFIVEGVTHDVPSFAMTMSRMTWRLQPALTERFFSARGVISSSSLASHASAFVQGIGARFGAPIVDSQGVMAGDDQGLHFSIVSLHHKLASELPAKRQAAWKLACDHLGAAMRLRKNLQSLSLDDPTAEMVFDRDGRLAHAAPHLRDRGHRELMHEAYQKRMHGCSVEQRHETDALEFWPALCSGRWSLVDRYDTDGKRFVVAYRNGVQERDPRGLSPREQQVARRVALGSTNASIAQELELSESAVRSHLATALKKLQLSSPTELILNWSAMTQGLTFSVKNSTVMVARTNYPPRVEAPQCTGAERTVVEALLVGASNQEIAEQRGVSLHTVESQITSIYAKLKVSSKRELAAKIFGEPFPTSVSQI